MCNVLGTCIHVNVQQKKLYGKSCFYLYDFVNKIKI